MNTLLRIIVLIIILVAFYGLSKLTKNRRYENKKEKTKKVLNILYYATSIILILISIFLLLPTYIFLAWNKILILLLFLIILFLIPYWFDDNPNIMEGTIVASLFITMFIVAFSSGVLTITGKQKFEKPIATTNSYTIAISSTENNNVAVQKIIDTDDEQYYVLTYLNKSENFVFLKAPVVNTEILIDYNSNDVAILETEEIVTCYNHTEITDRGNNFTYESEVNYTIYISDDLYYDQVN